VLIDERSGHEQGTSEPMGLGLLVPTRRHFQRRSIRNTLDRPHVPWNDDVAKFVADSEPLTSPTRIVLAQENLRTPVTQAHCYRVTFVRPGSVFDIAVLLGKYLDIDRWLEGKSINDSRRAAGRRIFGWRQ
jgi:hypothetical protein